MAESFLRFEKKYLLSHNQIIEIKKKLDDYVVPDCHPFNSLMSVYYDNDDYSLITKSIEKPMFKEKLRIRSYAPPLDNDKVYVELKKKFDGVVYKSRTMATYKDILSNIHDADFEDRQVGKEIKYLLEYYKGLKPKIFVSSDRSYYIGKNDKSLRITFDENMKYRTKNVYLASDTNDKPLTDKGIMEVKVYGAEPLWLTRILDDMGIYSNGFSKVGNAYLKERENIIYGII